MCYTIGQRQGLGIGGSGKMTMKFVIGKDLSTNTVGQGFHHPNLYSDSLTATDINLQMIYKREDVLNVRLEFRYRQQDTK